MKFAALALLFSSVAFAQPDAELVKRTLEGAGGCENFVRFDDSNVYLGFGAYRRGFDEPRKAIPSTVRVVPLGNAETAFSLGTDDSAIDSVSEGNSLFVLTYSGIEEWDLAAKVKKAKYATYANAGSMEYKEHPQAFARFRNKLVIAHGRLGVSVFDIESRRLTNQFRLVQNRLPLESMATGVAVVGKFAYFTMDNFSLVKQGQKPAFRGIVVVDLETETVVRELDGMDPFANAVASDGKKLLVSFDGDTIWKYGLDSLSARTLPEPERRVFSFPGKGHPLGRASVDENYYFTCYSQPPAKPGQGYKFLPLALDRKALQLD